MKFYITERIGPSQTDARRCSVVPRRTERATRTSGAGKAYDAGGQV